MELCCRPRANHRSVFDCCHPPGTKRRVELRVKKVVKEHAAFCVEDILKRSMCVNAFWQSAKRGGCDGALARGSLDRVKHGSVWMSLLGHANRRIQESEE